MWPQGISSGLGLLALVLKSLPLLHLPILLGWPEAEKKLLLRAGFEPATYGSLHVVNLYSPPLYQLSYRREHDMGGFKDRHNGARE